MLPDSSFSQKVQDEELQRLSVACRAPLVLCYLQGHTCDEAARQLGCSVRTIKRRLEQGRRSLRSRLARRGIALPAALLTVGLTQKATASVPAVLTATAARAALEAGSSSSTAAVLAEAVLRGLTASRLKIVAAILTLATLVIGIGAFVPQSPAQRPEVPAPAAPPRTPRNPGQER